MLDYKKLFISSNCSVREALEQINLHGSRIVIIVEKDNLLKGILTDGDIRRGLLQGKSISDPVKELMNSKPAFAKKYDSRDHIVNRMRRERIYQLPVLDEAGRVVGLELLDDYLLTNVVENWVVIMAGGLGTRLGDLTKSRPKPMLCVSGTPILEIIIKNFMSQGFKNFYISVNYMAHIIEDYFGFGDNLGINIQYLRELKQLGTAGSLTLIPPQNLNSPIIVINGDLITDINYLSMLEFHNQREVSATVALTDYKHQVPYGVIERSNFLVTQIKEKPISRYSINSGVYIFNPSAISLIPRNSSFDMPNLLQSLLEKKEKIGAYEINGYWRDVGSIDDYLSVQDEVTTENDSVKILDERISDE